MQIGADVTESAESAETALVRKAQAGSREAFGELVRQYQRRAVSVAYRLLGNVEDASDVSQDAFVRAHRSLSQLDDASRFSPWLMRVVTNLSLNYRRARATRAAASWDEVLAGSSEVRRPSGERTLTTQLADQEGSIPAELRAAIQDALDQLPKKQRLALVLFSVEGLPQKEVAEILECSVEMVKWNVFQARQKLKGLLEKYL